jgi:hypothetical protein
MFVSCSNDFVRFSRLAPALLGDAWFVGEAAIKRR